ncbi:MAG: PAS-domain containing protein [Alkalilacustris sp.]
MAASSLATALAALLLAHAVLRQRARRALLLTVSHQGPAEDAVLLFEGDALVEASDGGHALMRALAGGGEAWPRFCAWAEARFPGFTPGIARLSPEATLEMAAAPPLRLRLSARWCEGMIRVALQDPDAEGRTIPVDRLSLAAAEAELAHLRRMLDAAPLPVWREAGDGSVVWANPAYMRLACEAGGQGEALGWPLPRLFDLPPPADTPVGGQRLGLEGADAQRWFDCSTLPGAEGQRICYALPADAAMRAEAALQDVVQTLSRTFAHLPVGLAVFDSQRRLQIFNPALGDLTTLPVDFLISRPGFEAFFDALRSRQMIPEPRDYRAWRKGLTEIERAAASGHYQEVWSLAGGQTYRVTGRPHPDGAVAFLIEDVSAEVSLTRRFRAELETGQAVIDTLPEALAVFSPVGVLVMSNTAYADLWGLAPDTLVGEIGVAEALGVWKAACHPGPHWAQLRTLIGAGGPRRPWEGAIHLRDGRHMLCRLVPLQGGSTLVAFRAATEGARPARRAEAAPADPQDAPEGPRRATVGP